jgi:hypothetical protein
LIRAAAAWEWTLVVMNISNDEADWDYAKHTAALGPPRSVLARQTAVGGISLELFPIQ